ncbi:hypothetical protein [Nannocystis pusilla]|uniref:hypothetical protein n=1 Tax=Nannocystis pusilla TaxID=889268 RepID=UPI003B78D486
MLNGSRWTGSPVVVPVGAPVVGAVVPVSSVVAGVPPVVVVAPPVVVVVAAVVSPPVDGQAASSKRQPHADRCLGAAANMPRE